MKVAVLLLGGLTLAGWFVAWALARAADDADERARRMFAGMNEPLEAVRHLHRRTRLHTVGSGTIDGCDCCRVAWPCTTAQTWERDPA